MILKKEQIPNIGRIDSTSFLSDNEKEFVKAYFIREQEFRYALRSMSAKFENLDDYCEYIYVDDENSSNGCEEMSISSTVLSRDEFIAKLESYDMY